VTVDGVMHTVERVTDEARTAAVSAMVWSDDVLIADGHHRYGVARTHRDDVRAATGSNETPAELTLAFVSELVADQLSVDAIHRLYTGIAVDDLTAALGRAFELSPAGRVTPATLAEMVERGALCLVTGQGEATWMTPRPGAFDGVRALDGAWLEHALAGRSTVVTYQHGLDEVVEAVRTGTATAGVLIRPVPIGEIERTAREGLLMPPKSTFFTPKLRTGFVVRALD
jgi:uncharacterized protein (DUF1015 family)